MAESKTIIVTGASKGVGAATACWLGKASANVVLVARSKDMLAGVAQKVEEAGGKVRIVPADVARPSSCKKVVDSAMKWFNTIDGLINNAGIISPLAPIADSDIDQWQYAIEVNLLGPYYLTRYALPHLIERKGRIVNVSSGASNVPIPSASAYCTAKAGLTHFNRVLGEEVPDVTSVCIRPGVVDTAMQTRIRREGSVVMDPSHYTYYTELKTKGELEPPEIPARSIAWLSIYAPHNMSGEFRNYDDPDIQGPSITAFETALE